MGGFNEVSGVRSQTRLLRVLRMRLKMRAVGVSQVSPTAKSRIAVTATYDSVVFMLGSLEVQRKAGPGLLSLTLVFRRIDLQHSAPQVGTCERGRR